jgi:hypothetical protein
MYVGAYVPISCSEQTMIARCYGRSTLSLRLPLSLELPVFLEHARQVGDQLDMLPQRALHELQCDPSHDLSKERGREIESRTREVAGDRGYACGADGLGEGDHGHFGLHRQSHDFAPQECGGEAQFRARQSDERDRAGADRVGEGKQAPAGNAADGGMHARDQTACDEAARGEAARDEAATRDAAQSSQNERDEHRRERGADDSGGSGDTGGACDTSGGGGGDDLGVLFYPLACGTRSVKRRGRCAYTHG